VKISQVLKISNAWNIERFAGSRVQGFRGSGVEWMLNAA